MKLNIALSVLLSLSFNVKAQTSSNERTILNPFKDGYAKIVTDHQTYYINTSGQKITPPPDKAGVLPPGKEALEKYENELKKNPAYLPATVSHFTNDKGKTGIQSPAGDVLVAALYDDINTGSRLFWKLYQNGKVSLYLPDKKTLPFFDDIGYLDGEHFDIKQNGKWSIYSKSKGKVITQNQYDGFDYCGGCGKAASYVYAKKGNKWGIIDWNEKVLIPFEYNHYHSGMRSDNWVQTFSKSETEFAILNLASKEVFDFRKGKIIGGSLIYQKDGKFGLYSQNATLVLPFEYDLIEEPNANSYLGYSGPYLIVHKNKKQGVINHQGNIIIPVEYDEIKVYEAYFSARKKNITYLIDSTKKVLTQVENGEISHVNDYFYSSGSKGNNIFRIKKRAYSGLYFPETNTYYEPAYYNVSVQMPDEEDATEFLIAERQGIITVFDLKGKQIIPSGYNNFRFSNSLPDEYVWVFKNELVGIFDIKNQKEIVPPLYNKIEVSPKAGAGLLIATGGNYETPFIDLFDKKGNQLINKTIKTIDRINDNIYLLNFSAGNSKPALLDVKEMKIKEINYPYVYATGSNELLLVSKNNETANLYQVNKQKILKDEYDITYQSGNYSSSVYSKHPSIYTFKKGIAKIESEKGYGYINEEGKVILPPTYKLAEDFPDNGIIMFGEPSKQYGSSIYQVGFMNLSGKIVFPIEKYSYHRALLPEDLCLNGKVILPKMDIYPEKYGLGDIQSGKILLEMVYDYIRPIHQGKYLLLEANKKFGIADLNGQIIVSVEFDNLHIPNEFTEQSEPLFPLLVKKGKQWMYRLENGKYLEQTGSDINLY
ncbi:WG repeat-containing protein [Gynurincola endophyticus]|uniref:WG repeat-containing protein n=1 Tax=Gynurincola endophyticus TaxID=2479004 RepID=UPI000F8F35E3|nr:WG repeat-containing protein [Gynurincola endophyticus]